MRARNVHRKLTPEQRDLVTIAYSLVEDELREKCRVMPFFADLIVEEFGLRLTLLISTFDPSRSSLFTWAFNQLKYAVRDARRRDGRSGDTLRRAERVRSVDAETMDAASDDAARGLMDAEDLEEHMIFTLPLTHRHIVRMSVRGYTNKEIATAAGIAESYVSKILASSRPVIQARLDRLAALSETA